MNDHFKRLRRRILEMTRHQPAAHIAPAFSCLEIVDTVYRRLMQSGDTFIMSKGHGYLAQLVVMEDLGLINTVTDYCTPNSPYGAHPDLGAPGIAAATGALGHGLGMALGMALADRAHQVYVVMSDGEMQEGSTWEAALVTASLKIGNLCVLVDNNDFVSATRVSEVQYATYPIVDKWRAFGWLIANCDGHVVDDIVSIESISMRAKHKPRVVVFDTIKGHGVSFMENQGIWHYRCLTPKEYELAMKELA